VFPNCILLRDDKARFCTVCIIELSNGHLK
jgi:hypothetical protein